MIHPGVYSRRVVPEPMAEKPLPITKPEPKNKTSKEIKPSKKTSKKEK